MYFVGLCKCFICNKTEELKADFTSDWRAIKADNKLYYFCDDCVPQPFASQKNWNDFYTNAITKIYKKDFQRPIKEILILRDSENPILLVV